MWSKQVRALIVLAVIASSGAAETDDGWEGLGGGGSVLLEAAKGLLEESLGEEGGGPGAALLGALLGGGGKVGAEGGAGMGGELLWNLLGAAAGGHRHEEDPALEDSHGHQRHETATRLIFDWLKGLWERGVPREWTQPLQETMALFTGPDGSLRLEPLFASLENPSFRRRWIRTLSGFVAHWVKHLSLPHVRARYVKDAAAVMNTMLEGHDQLDINKPLDESLTNLINSFFRRQFAISVNSATYVKPVMRYANELLMIGQGSVSQLSASEIEDKLAETLNSEVIESVLRVWRAHRYAINHPQCDKYLICHVNFMPQQSKSTLKPGVTKLASLVSSWFLSGHTGTSFFALYNAAVENYNCETTFPADCSGFHEEDIRITTEYAHNEL